MTEPVLRYLLLAATLFVMVWGRWVGSTRVWAMSRVVSNSLRLRQAKLSRA